jgi:hypothetical protein
VTGTANRPPAWAVLERAVGEMRPVRARYHGHERLLCPHALGWSNGRAMVLSYQAGGTTSQGPLPHDPRQRWRCMFVDEIEAPALTDDPWKSADNYAHHAGCIHELEIEVHAARAGDRTPRP